MHTRYPDQRYLDSASLITSSDTVAILRREGKSHRGLSSHGQLRELCAFGVDQDFLQEISTLPNLTHLELGWPITARDFSSLRALKGLTYLRLDSPRNMSDFSTLLELPALQFLFIENAKHLLHLDWLQPLKNRLQVLGIEGSISTTQAIASLKPLAGFELEALFLTSTRLTDKDLSPIASMPRLRLLETAANVPKAQFLALQAANPKLHCDWFGEEKWRELDRLKSAARKR